MGDNAIKQQSKTAETTSRAGVESLDYSIASEQNNDYYSKDEYAAQFKKKKTKKRAIKKQVMNEDEEEIVINDDRDTLNFVDDHDLQAALARSRRQAVEKPKPSIQELAETLLNDDTASSIEQKGHLEVSETTEFVQKLLSTSLPAIPESKVRVERNESNVSDDQMDVTVDNDDDDDSVNINHHQQHNEEAEQQAVKELIEEPTVDGGMASTLKLLKQKGLIEKRTEDDIKRDQLILEHQKWAMKRKANATAAEPLPSTEAVQQRRLTRREEVEREQQRAKELEEKFKDYKPVINLVYRDEFGRALSQKEAYKQLSHKFHGKQPGKQKTEKRLKRIAEEMAIQRAENSSLRGIESIAERQKEAGAAHLLLSSASAGKG